MQHSETFKKNTENTLSCLKEEFSNLVLVLILIKKEIKYLKSNKISNEKYNSNSNINLEEMESTENQKGKNILVFNNMGSAVNINTPITFQNPKLLSKIVGK